MLLYLLFMCACTEEYHGDKMTPCMSQFVDDNKAFDTVMCVVLVCQISVKTFQFPGISIVCSKACSG